MNFYGVTLFLSATACLTLAVVAWYRRPAEGAKLLSLLLLTMGLTSLAYGLDSVTPSLPLKIFWNHAQYLVGMPIPSLMVLLALCLSGQSYRIKPALVIFLISICALIVLVNFTNGWHHLTYRSVWVADDRGIFLLAKERGPLYWLLPTYEYIAIPWAALIVLRRLFNVRGLYRIQLGLILAAIMAPIIFNVPYILRLMPDPHLNLTLLGFTIACLALAWGMFRHRLLDVIPYSRESFFEQSSDALIVMDLTERILDFNPTTAKLLPSPTAQWIGKPISLLVESVPALSGLLKSPPAPDLTLNDRRYQVRVWPLIRSANRTLGHFVCLSDITEQHRIQEELRRMIANREEELRQATREALHATEEESRRIGQDIHDGLCQELIGLSRLTEQLAKEVPTADQKLGQLLKEVGNQAAHLARLARDYSHDLTMHNLEVQSLPEALAVMADRMEHLFQVNIEINIGSELDFLSNDQSVNLYRIVREGVSNAIRHAKATTIWIDIVQQEKALVISVSSNGQPISTGQKIVSGLGLRQIAMRARLIGATARLIPRPDLCATLKVILPRPS